MFILNGETLHLNQTSSKRVLEECCFLCMEKRNVCSSMIHFVFQTQVKMLYDNMVPYIFKNLDKVCFYFFNFTIIIIG